jgi:hypothetical protein
MNKVNSHGDKWIDFLTRIYVSRISNSSACASVEEREISENQEKYGLEFETSEKPVQEIKYRRRRFSPVIF